MPTRTPVRVDSFTAWVDPQSGTVRVGTADRYRTVFAGVPPTSYLMRAEQQLVLATADSNEALIFAFRDGVPDAVATVVKPGWCAAVEEALPEPLEATSSWLEIALSNNEKVWCCSIPAGTLPRVQTGILRQGFRLRRITHIQVTPEDDS